MKERRKHARSHLVYYLMVFDARADELIGHLVDVAAEGVQLIGDEPTRKGTAFQLKIVFPTKVGGSGELTLDAKIVWSRDDISPGYYHTGFQLLGIGPKDAEVIEHLMDELGSND